MHLKVQPGMVVVLRLTELGDMTNVTARTVVTTVAQVQVDSIAVVEADSFNGLAELNCHGESDKDGAFWYEYFGRERRDGHVLNVVRLDVLDGEGGQIHAPFIED